MKQQVDCFSVTAFVFAHLLGEGRLRVGHLCVVK